MNTAMKWIVGLFIVCAFLLGFAVGAQQAEPAGCTTLPLRHGSFLYIDQMLFITDISGYRDYVEKENNIFYPGEIIFVYTELKNLTYDDEGKVGITVYARVINNENIVLIEKIILEYYDRLPSGVSLEEVYLVYRFDPAWFRLPFGLYHIERTYTNTINGQVVIGIMTFRWSGIPI